MKPRDFVHHELYIPIVRAHATSAARTSAEDSIVELARMLGCIATKVAIHEAIDRLFASVPVISPKATKPLITASQIRAKKAILGAAAAKPLMTASEIRVAKEAGCSQWDFLAAKQAIRGPKRKPRP